MGPTPRGFLGRQIITARQIHHGSTPAAKDREMRIGIMAAVILALVSAASAED
jgi:hypothetical protein